MVARGPIAMTCIHDAKLPDPESPEATELAHELAPDRRVLPDRFDRLAHLTFRVGSQDADEVCDLRGDGQRPPPRHYFSKTCASVRPLPRLRLSSPRRTSAANSGSERISRVAFSDS